MKREYDFSKAVRGKFYRKNARVRLPIYLDIKVQERLQRLSQKNGKAIDAIVNQMVQKEMELLEELT
jgi:cytidylate kinase